METKKRTGLWFYKPQCRGKKKLPKDFYFCPTHAKQYWEEHYSIRNIKITIANLKAKNRKA
jgi:hypothetical protein